MFLPEQRLVLVRTSVCFVRSLPLPPENAFVGWNVAGIQLFFVPLRLNINECMKENATQAIFDKNTVEFVTVAAEFCGFLERASGMGRRRFVDTALKLLPLLYLKASLLPDCERMEEADPETFVTEGDYEMIRSTVEGILAGYDDYLEVFLDDMAYSDSPIRQTVSEGMADVYQPLKDFVCVFQLGLRQTMNDSLVICRELFAEFWGQRLVNVMRALHDVKYRQLRDGEEVSDAFDDTCMEEELYEGLDMGDDE